MENKIHNYLLDAIKGAAAILIICIHAPFPGVIGQYIVAVARSGVALFFLISGYYLCDSQLNISKENIAKKVKHILKIILLSYLFYFLWGIFVRYVGTGIDSVKSWIIGLFNLRILVRILFLHEDVIAGHLWFLNALLVCYIFAYIFQKKILSKSILYLAIGLLVCNFLFMNILPLITNLELPFSICRNGWFYGLPVFILGIFLRKYYSNFDDYSSSELLTMIFISLFTIGLERWLIGYSQLYFSNLLLLGSVFIYAQKFPNKVGCTDLNAILGLKYSMYIYIIQWAVINLIGKVFTELNWNIGVMFSIVCIIASIIAAVLIKEIERLLLNVIR